MYYTNIWYNNSVTNALFNACLRRRAGAKKDKGGKVRNKGNKIRQGSPGEEAALAAHLASLAPQVRAESCCYDAMRLPCYTRC